MGSIRKSFAACFQNFRKWAANPRIYIILLLLFTFINISEQGLKPFLQTVNLPITPCLFPFIMSDWYQLFIIMLGLIMFFWMTNSRI